MDATGKAVASSPTTSAMVAALRQAMATHPVRNAVARVVRAVDLDNLHSSYLCAGSLVESQYETEVLLCPLTLNLPTTFSFPHQEIYQVCRDVAGLRDLVDRQLGYATGDGCFWLPVVLTGKGPLYGEAIGLREILPSTSFAASRSLEVEALRTLNFSSGNTSTQLISTLEEGGTSQLSEFDSYLAQTTDGCDRLSLSTLCLSYCQPIHLCDAKRQGIYKLAYRLLQLLAAPPATYLVQFAFQGEDICFDRLWPFPAAPALASLGVQSPDLFACHWHCLTGLPLFDLTILP